MIVQHFGKGLVLFFFLSVAIPTRAAVSVSLSAGETQPQPVGATIHWTAAASSSGGGPMWYRFAVRDSSGASYTAKDFSPDSTFAWTPSEQEDIYGIQVTAMDTSSKERGKTSEPFTISAIVSGTSAMVNQTNSPLVAFYSAPACPVGSNMDVRFQQAGSSVSAITAAKPCTGKSMNFYVGGMYPNSSYTMEHEVITGSEVATGPPLTFQSGSPTCNVPPITLNLISMLPGSLGQSVILWAPIQNGGEPFATDIRGNVLWCFPQTAGYLPRPLAGGEFFILFTDGTDLAKNQLAIIDLAGNIVQETSVPQMNQELAAAGYSPITQFHHDARQLSNGDILVLSASERILVDKQGPGPVDVVGDMILVLNSNLHLKWVWDSFAHLDVTRKAVLGETCPPGGLNGCPPVLLSSIANDWTHGNSIDLTADGDIIYSSRHQDFIYRIDYKNGSGTGNVIWKLGQGGDFSTDSNDRYPWNSHQHDVEYDGTGLMTVFDNGNTRNALLGPDQQSRGQVLKIDETNHFVHYVMNQPLGVFSFALGTAQALSDGNYYFEAGYVENGLSLTQIAEFMPGGKRVYQARTSQYMYRAFRMNSLYQILLPNTDPEALARDVPSNGFTQPATTATESAAVSSGILATNTAAPPAGTAASAMELISLPAAATAAVSRQTAAPAPRHRNRLPSPALGRPSPWSGVPAQRCR